MTEVGELNSPAFRVRRGGKTEHPSEFLGFVEVLTDWRVKGWAIKRDDGDYLPTVVVIEGSRRSIRLAAGDHRPDLFEEMDVDFGGFDIAIDLATLGDVRRVYFADTNEDVEQLTANGAIERIDGPLIRGWAMSTIRTVAEVEVYVDDVKVKTTTCDTMRPEVFGTTGSRACIGFGVRIPGRFRGRALHKVELKLDGQLFGRPIFKRFSPLRVLIVSESEKWEDASRYYRCDNLKLMLNMRGMEASVIGANEFHQKDWSLFDVVVMARVKMTPELEAKIVQCRRQYRTVFVYEVDDLIFLPWEINGMGSVRSGVDIPNNPEIEKMFACRLRSIRLCDFGISTTQLIADKLGDLGLNSIVVPNALRIEQIEEMRSKTATLNILCMAGSDTHYADFSLIEHELFVFLQQNPRTASLTLLGKFREDTLLTSLPNVTRVERQTYPDMLESITRHDICVVPLETTEFNHAKSCLKFIECGSRAVPVIASPVADYKRVIRHGVNGFIASKPGDWLRILSDVQADPESLRVVGENALNDVVNHFTVESMSNRVADWFENEVAV
jgi:glycosyltransferase involved in cell wall biosynthesis